MRRAPLFLALALTLSLASCAAPGTGETPTPSPAATPAPVPEATPIPALTWTEQIFARDFTAGDGAAVMSVRYSFPGIAGTGTNPAWSKIHDFYAAEGEAYLANAVELSGWAADDYAVAKATGGGFTPYREEADWRIAHQTDALVSIVRTYYGDSVAGVQNPTYYQFAEQFDLATGDRLALDDFFTDPDAARTRILDQLEEKARDSGFSRAALESAFHEEYFYLAEGNFFFFYQPDTLAPYSAGLLQFTIPYDVLEDLLRREV